MRRALKIVFALGLAGLVISGYVLWRELFVHQGPLLGTPAYVYAAFVFLVLGTIIALHRTRPPGASSLHR